MRPVNPGAFFLFSLFLLFFISAEIHAWRDFNRFKLGADANGIGGAFVADASTETAVVYNPAGLVQITNSLSFAYEVYSGFEFVDPLAWNIAVNFDLFPFFAATGSFDKMKWGLSVGTLFHSLLRENDMSIRAVMASAAYPVLENFSVGAGIGPVFASERKGYGFSFAYNIGILWKAAQNFQLGVCFHSPVDIAWTYSDKGGSLQETYPWVLDAGAAFRLNGRMDLFASLEYVNMDSVRYIVDGTDYSPRFDGNLFLRLHPHFGIRFVEEITGAHLSFGVMTESSYYDSGSVNQYLLTMGVRAYGKNTVFQASLVDALLIGLFYPGNVREEKINVSFGFYPAMDGQSR